MDLKITIAAKKTKTLPLYKISESTTTTKESDTDIFSKDLELLDNTLGKSSSLLQRIIEEVKKSILYFRIIIA